LLRLRHWATWPVVHAIATHKTPLQQAQYDFLLRAQWETSLRNAKNPLNRYGAKFFSSTDEDGITLEILRRLGVKDGTFVEIGVGNGLENNTLVLLANGWRGVWIGGEELAFNHQLNSKRLAFLKAWVTLDNLIPLLRQGFENIGTASANVDVLSIDLDGNDYYFTQEILKNGISPKLLILEYNAKFPPSAKWTIKYNPNHIWDRTDYFGASLGMLTDLLRDFSYTPVCCNAATGSNAFFIKDEYLPCFDDVPKSINDIFIGCRYELYQQWGHPPSPKTIERMLS
jgi:hypothetical protein